MKSPKRLMPLFLFVLLSSGTFAGEKARDPIFCQGVHTCTNVRTQRFTCPVYGFFQDNEEAMDYLSGEECCEEYNNSYSIGFNFIGCGRAAPHN